MWVPVDGREVALVVVDGVIVEVWPLFLGARWRNRRAELVRLRLNFLGVPYRWSVGVRSFRPALDDTTCRVRRWQRVGQIAAKTDTLTLGKRGDGSWWVATTGQAGVGWLFPDFGSALAEVSFRVAQGGWERVPANYDPLTRDPLPDHLLDGDGHFDGDGDGAAG